MTTSKPNPYGRDYIQTVSVVVDGVEVDFGYDSKEGKYFIFYGPFSITGIRSHAEMSMYLDELGVQ